MSYQVLARKWRPRKFADVIGESHVVTTLKNSIKDNKLAHAHLLTGTRGVGKTTVARILGKTLKCLKLSQDTEPCLECDNCVGIEKGSCLDYTEIDGASHTGVDNIRELIENVQYLPVSGQKKIYVIDEVHMLSTSAFNALLKTLEEPPEHVVFIFATTDPQKLLGTVLSRVQRHDFRRVSVNDLTEHLKKISKAEGIEYEDDSCIVEIARHGDGSVRDTLSLLDQVLSFSADKLITKSNLVTSLGLVQEDVLNQLLTGLFLRDKQLVSKQYKSITQANISSEKFSKQLLDTIFSVIESVNQELEIISSDTLSDSLKDISIGELLWIYEVLNKDLSWSASSLSSSQSIYFSLLKVCLRNEVLGIESPRLKKKSDKQTVKPISSPIAAPVAPKRELSWDGFIEFLFTHHKTIASNLEHGGLDSPLELESDPLDIKFAIKEQDQVFYEHLDSSDSKKAICEEAKKYFEKSHVNFTLKLSQKDDFQSKVEKDDHRLEQKRQRVIESIKNNKHILEAQNLFECDINKINLN